MPAPKSKKPSAKTPTTASRKAGGILVLNGPNLNLLGTRQPDIYGKVTLADVEASCRAATEEVGIALDFRQSNHEGELIDWVQQARGNFQAIIINAGGYSHTSIALMDALLLADMPIYEVHVSNIYRREAFRHHSYISSVATGVLCGFGVAGYIMALYAAIDVIEASNTNVKNT